MRRRNIPFFAGCALLLALYLGHEAGLLINTTPSLPRGLWWLDRGAEWHRGDIVAFCPPDNSTFQLARDRGYIGRHTACPGGYELMLKPVVGLPGDSITIQSDGVTINGVAMAHSVPVANDTQNRPLPQAAPSLTVAPGHVWLFSNWNPRSFDSRYFGEIPAGQIVGRAYPLITEAAFD